MEADPEDVASAQKLLAANKECTSYPEAEAKLDGVVGPKTTEAIKQVQRQAALPPSAPSLLQQPQLLQL